MPDRPNEDMLLLREPVTLHDGTISVVSIYDDWNGIGGRHWIYLVRITHGHKSIFSGLKIMAPKTVAIDNEHSLRKILALVLCARDEAYTDEQNDFVDKYHDDFVKLYEGHDEPWERGYNPQMDSFYGFQGSSPVEQKQIRVGQIELPKDEDSQTGFTDNYGNKWGIGLMSGIYYIGKTEDDGISEFSLGRNEKDAIQKAMYIKRTGKHIGDTVMMNPGGDGMTELLTDPITKRKYYVLEAGAQAPQKWFTVNVQIIDKQRSRKYEQVMAFESEQDAHLVLDRWNGAEHGRRIYLMTKKGV